MSKLENLLEHHFGKTLLQIAFHLQQVCSLQQRKTDVCRHGYNVIQYNKFVRSKNSKTGNATRHVSLTLHLYQQYGGS